MTDDSPHLNLPRGFHDLDPARAAELQRLRHLWFTTCALFGYQQVEIPPVGFEETFTTGHHAAGERFYRFADRRGRPLALVSDSLPAALRLANRRDIAEQRLSYCCPVFRYERKPRRHFHHLGLMDVIQRAGEREWADRSMVRIGTVIGSFLASMGIPLEVTISSPGIWHRLAAQCVATDKVTELVNALRRTDPHARGQLLARNGASRTVTETADRLAVDPELTITSQAVVHPGLDFPLLRTRLAKLAEAWRNEGARTKIDCGLLHASEFHDGIALLFRTANDRQTLGDGGSYGVFAQTFLNKPTSVQCAVLGLERLADILAAGQPQPLMGAADVAILLGGGPNEKLRAEALVSDLRRAGISVWDTCLDRTVAHHLRNIAALSIQFSVIFGEREARSGKLHVRAADGTLTTVAQDDLATWLRRSLAGRQAHPGHRLRSPGAVAPIEPGAA